MLNPGRNYIFENVRIKTVDPKSNTFKWKNFGQEIH